MGQRMGPTSCMCGPMSRSPSGYPPMGQNGSMRNGNGFMGGPGPFGNPCPLGGNCSGYSQMGAGAPMTGYPTMGRGSGPVGRPMPPQACPGGCPPMPPQSSGGYPPMPPQACPGGCSPMGTGGAPPTGMGSMPMGGGGSCPLCVSTGDGGTFCPYCPSTGGGGGGGVSCPYWACTGSNCPGLCSYSCCYPSADGTGTANGLGPRCDPSTCGTPIDCPDQMGCFRDAGKHTVWNLREIANPFDFVDENDCCISDVVDNQCCCGSLYEPLVCSTYARKRSVPSGISGLCGTPTSQLIYGKVRTNLDALRTNGLQDFSSMRGLYNPCKPCMPACS